MLNGVSNPPGQYPGPPVGYIPAGLFSLMNSNATTRKNRVAFFVDGYNLYHAIDNIVKGNPSLNYLKWVDLRKLFTYFIQPQDDEIADIFFFTARPIHTPGDVQQRYSALMIAYQRFLKIHAVYGKFKKKMQRCKTCGAVWPRHEEKESDVNLAVYIVREAYEKKYDSAFIVTQDSDLEPAVKLTEAVRPGFLRLLTPPGIFPSREISRAVLGRVSQIKQIHLEHSLMNAEYCDDSGAVVVQRPAAYNPPT